MHLLLYMCCEDASVKILNWLLQDFLMMQIWVSGDVLELYSRRQDCVSLGLIGINAHLL